MDPPIRRDNGWAVGVTHREIIMDETWDPELARAWAALEAAVKSAGSRRVCGTRADNVHTRNGPSPQGWARLLVRPVRRMRLDACQASALTS